VRGHDDRTDFLFSYVSPEQRVSTDRRLRTVLDLTDAAIARLSQRFAQLYSEIGWSSIPPEQPLRALILQVLYSMRSERVLIEQLDYSLFFRWLVGEPARPGRRHGHPR